MKCCGTCINSYYDKDMILRCPKTATKLMELGVEYGSGCNEYVADCKKHGNCQEVKRTCKDCLHYRENDYCGYLSKEIKLTSLLTCANFTENEYFLIN